MISASGRGATTPRTAVIRTVNDSKPSATASEMIGISMYFVPSPVLFHDTVPDTAMKSSSACAVPSMAAQSMENGSSRDPVRVSGT